MLIGYVSDEMDIALADVQLELVRDGTSVEARSRATGASACRSGAGHVARHAGSPGTRPQDRRAGCRSSGWHRIASG